MKKTIFFLMLFFLTSNLFGQERKLVVNDGHSGFVNSVSFSGDGRYWASGSEDSMIKIWEVSTGRLIRTLKGHNDAVNRVQFSSDGRYLTSGSKEDYMVKIWEVSTGRLLQTFENFYGIESMSISGDGRYLASGRGNEVKVWEVLTGHLLWSLKGHSKIVDNVSFSADSRYLASGSWDNTVKIWKVSTGRLLRTLEGHNNWVKSVSFSLDGRYLASGSYDRTVKIWKISTGRLLRTFEGHNIGAENISFSADSRYLISGNEEVKVWEVSTGSLLNTFDFDGNIIGFSLDGHYVASRSYDSTVKIWEVTTGQLLYTLKNSSVEIVDNVAFSSNGHYVAFGSRGNINIWEVSRGHLFRIFEGNGNSIYSLSFSADGQYLASGSKRNINIWETSTGRLVRTLKGNSSEVYSVSFSADSQYLASGSLDNTVKIWKVSTGHLLHTLEGHSESVLSLNFSADGQYLTSRSKDNIVKVWGVFTGYLYQTLNEHNYYADIMSFSADGQYLASGNHYSNVVKVTKASTERLLCTLKGHTSYINSISFSTNGQYLASGSMDNTVKIWEINNGKCLLTLRVFDKGTAYVITTPNGKYDGNETGLEYLHYIEGMKAIPLPKNDPNYVKGLVTKVLKVQTIIRTIAKIELDFTNPPENIVVTTPKYELKALVKNLGGNPLSLLQNQKTISYQLEGKWLSAKVQLLEGENRFTLQTEQNGERIATNITITYQKPQTTPHFRTGKDHALLFAVKDYDHWNNLQNPIRDAEAIAGELKSSYGFDTKVVKNANYLEIQQELEKVLKRAYAEDEQLFVYFSGHGDTTTLSRGHFIPKEARQNHTQDYFSYADIKEIVERGNCHHVLLVIDACYSSSADDLLAMNKGKRPNFEADFDLLKNFQNNNPLKKFVKDELTSKSQILITSGLGKTSDGIHHSPMTLELLKALRNLDGFGMVSIESMQTQIQDNMKRKGYKPPHFGELKGHDGGRFLFISLEKQ